MKLSILFAVAVSTTLSFSVNAAEIAFLKDTKVPGDLRSRIVEAVESKCSTSLLSLKEIGTTVSVDWIDQGVRDNHYNTEIAATYLFDGTHSAQATITVKSAEYSFSNPAVDRLEILSVNSNPADLCL